jgi:hypothetical protein
MYEFVPTPTGWRLFWGIDPLVARPEPKQDAQGDQGTEGPDVLPFRRPDPGPQDRPAA